VAVQSITNVEDRLAQQNRFEAPVPIKVHGKAMVSASQAARAARTSAVCVALFLALAVVRGAQGASAKPLFLVATPDMPDPLFARSVILMLPSAPPPLVAGLIINKPTNVRVRALFPHASALKGGSENAYFGGPVDLTEPCLILRGPEPSAKASRLFDDVYVSTDPDSIARLLTNPQSAKDLRLVLGRAQWTRDQLHGEMLRGSWYVARAQADLVFNTDPEAVWRLLVRRAQLQEVDATRLEEPSRFALLRLEGGQRAWLP
jgi:putative transcriptional regulator